MIVSHQHRFIFLKTRKTAGSSVELALSKHCGDEDVLTLQEDELRGAIGGRGAQNLKFPLSRYAPRDWARLIVKRRTPLDVPKTSLGHLPADVVKQLVGNRVWDSYYKFTIERNPWDAAISSYYWRTRDGGPLDPNAVSLSEFIRSGRSKAVTSNFDVYSIDGQVAVDKVCRYESLAEDLEQVRLRIGLKEPLELPRAKGSHRTDRRNYADVLDSEEVAIIGTHAAPTIDLMGYTFTS